MSGVVNLLVTVSAILLSTSAYAVEGAQQERFDREVDQVALSAQEQSINKLATLLKKYSGKSQEVALLSKLGELQQQKASILFRVANGKSKGKKDAVDLNAYHLALHQTIATLDTLLKKYPHNQDAAKAYFLRGKSYEDLENKPAAAKDYDYLVKHFPDSERAPSAYMSLAEFATDDGNHALAISYLQELENRPNDPRYPFALYKLAWAFYNLKNIPRALSYAERQIHYYDDKLDKSGQKDKAKDDAAYVSSDDALRESTLLDVPVFYFEGLEEGNSKFALDGALDYFRGLDKGPALGRILIRFAKLLRSHDMQKDLLSWKNQVLDQEWERNESLDVLVLTYEFLQNKRNYPEMIHSAQDLIGLYKKMGREKLAKNEAFGKSQKMILDTATTLQALIIKNKNSKEARPLSNTLASLYSSFMQVVPETDPRIPQIHYNLAETLFTIQDYDGATEHYRWIVERMATIPAVVAPIVADSPIKAIASRYETLRAKGFIPTEIIAKAMPPETETGPKLDAMLETWIAWIDSAAPKAKNETGWDNFNFEGNRAIYAAGDTRRSVTRLEAFALLKPTSSYAIPSASLVLDTYVVANNWDAVLTKTTQYQKLGYWSGTEFGKRLYQLAADSLYKKIEGKYALKDYKNTIQDAESFMRDYPDSKRAPDCLSLAGAAALASGEKEIAKKYFSKLIGNGTDPQRVADALLARAAIQEGDYEFTGAIADYQTYLNVSSKKADVKALNGYRKRILTLALLSETPQALATLAEDKTICPEKQEELQDDCAKYKALAALEKTEDFTPSLESTERAFNAFRKMDNSETKTIWAIYALQGAKHLAFRDRNVTLRTVGSGWKDLDPLLQFQLLSFINSAVPKALDMNRASMKDVAPLKASEKYIAHRVDSIRELENAVAKVMELPWSRIRAETLNVLASTYQDLADGLSALPAPKDLSESDLASYQNTIQKLVVPFEEKGQDIRSKAFDVASNFAIEDEAMAPIQSLFFAENPSLAKKLKADAQTSKTGANIPKGLKYTELSLDYLPAIEADAQKANGKQLLGLWVRAVKDKNWAKVAFFLKEWQDAKNNGKLSVELGNDIGLMRAISLAAAGARGEGLAELEEARKSVSPKLKLQATMTLAFSHEKAYSASRARDFYADFAPEAPVVASKEATQDTGDGTDQVRKESNRKPASSD